MTNESDFEVSVGGGSDTSKVDVEEEIGWLSEWSLAALFLMLGVGSLLAWNVLLNLAFVFKELWAGTLNSTVLPCYFGGSLVSVALLTYFHSFTTNIWITRTTCAVFVFGLIAIAFAPFLFHDGTTRNTQGAVFFISFLAVITGMGGGVFQCQAFAYSNLLPSMADQAYVVSLGMAFVGITVWLLFLAVFNAVDVSTVKGLRIIAVTLCVLSAGVMVVVAILFEYCMTIPPFRRAVFGSESSGDKKPQGALAAAAAAAEAPPTTYGSVQRRASLSSCGSERMPIRLTPEAHAECESVYDVDTSDAHISRFDLQILKKAIHPCIMPGLVLFCTLITYPLIAPFKWKPDLTVYHMGVFQVLDVGVRLLLSLVSKWGYQMGRLTTDVLILSRFLLLPLCILPATSLKAKPFFSSEVTLFTISSVWAITHAAGFSSSCVLCMRCPKTKLEIDVFACMMALLIIIGGFAGSSLSKIPDSLL